MLGLGLSIPEIALRQSGTGPINGFISAAIASGAYVDQSIINQQYNNLPLLARQQGQYFLIPGAYKNNVIEGFDYLGNLAPINATRTGLGTLRDKDGFIKYCAHNLVTNSEGTVSQLSSSSNVSDATISMTGFDHSIQFGNNSIVRNATKTFSTVVGATYQVQVFVEMDDETVPKVGASNDNTADFSLVGGGNVITGTVALYKGNQYIVSGTFVEVSASSCAIDKFTTQSAKGFRITGYMVQQIPAVNIGYIKVGSSPIYMPRLDFDPVAGANYIIEPLSATNLLLNSVFSGGGSAPTSWTQPVPGTSAPAASTYTNIGTGYSQSAAAQRPFISQNITVSANTNYSFSVLIEAFTGTLTVHDVISTGVVLGTETITYQVNGGPDVSPTLPITAGSIVSIRYSSTTGGAQDFRCGLGCQGAVTGTISFSMPQLEISFGYRTSWIPTWSATVTRPADGVPVTVASWLNYTEASAYTFFAHTSYNNGAPSANFIDTTGGRLSFNSPQTQIFVFDGTAAISVTVPFPAWNKYCFSFGAAGQKIVANNGTLNSGVYDGDFGQANPLRFYDTGSGRNTMNLQSLVTFNRQLTTAEMGILTT